MEKLKTNRQKILYLYKVILRLHRGLPEDIKNLGDSYVKSEFKSHKNVGDSERQIFIAEWTNYALTLTKQLGLKGPKTGSKTIGVELNEKLLDKMRDDQIQQLYELMVATKKIENDKS